MHCGGRDTPCAVCCDGQSTEKHSGAGESISVDALQIVEPLNWESHEDLLDLLKRNYEQCLGLGKASYADEHFAVGGGRCPYLGFADCSLPLVLYHNTPNNTLPVLWYSWEETVYPLFPRVTRHKEN